MPSASWRCCTTALERLPWKRRGGQREGWGRMGVDGGGGGEGKLRIFSGMMAMAWLRWFAIGCDWKVDAPE